ncbi:ATP-dependent helicase, partial [Salmonella enterica]|nr:ATP-dependent helicase [Salmonella enterica]
LPNAFDVFKKDFEVGDHNELVSNRRSLKNLISYQRLMESFINKTENKTEIIFYKGEGLARLMQFEEVDQEASYIASLIKKWIDEGIEQRDICILSKSVAGQYSQKTISELDMSGVKCRIENEYQELLNEAIVQLVLQLLMFVCNRKSIEGWASTMDLLCNIRGVSRKGDVTRLERELSNFIKANKEIRSDVVDYLKGLLSIFGISELKSYFPQYMNGNGLEHNINTLSKYLEELDIKNNMSNAIDMLNGIKTVPFMTIHKSKGLEFRKVVIVGLEPDAYFGDEEGQIENQKTVFVGFSRAIDEVFMTRCKLRMDNFGNMSRQDFNRIPLITDMLTYCGIEAEDYQG